MSMITGTTMKLCMGIDRAVSWRHKKSAADPEIFPRGMTHQNCGPMRRPSFFDEF